MSDVSIPELLNSSYLTAGTERQGRREEVKEILKNDIKNLFSDGKEKQFYISRRI